MVAAAAPSARKDASDAAAGTARLCTPLAGSARLCSAPWGSYCARPRKAEVRASPGRVCPARAAHAGACAVHSALLRRGKNHE